MNEKPMSKIYESLQAVSDELKVIEKNQKGYNYNFRGIDQVYNAVGPLLKKNNIVIRRCVMEVMPIASEKEIEKGMNHFLVRVNYAFVSTLDGSEFLSWSTGEGTDKGDKAIACAISNAYKYQIWEMFNIATEDLMDSDQKTAKENKVDPPAKGKKEETEDSSEEKTSSFRRNKVSKGEL